MTAGEETCIASEEVPEKGEESVPKEVTEIVEFLSLNEKIIFKSQQIDDPELERMEKVQIAQEIFRRNRQTFLQRFGSYFQEQHLDAFGRLASSAVWNAHESGEEIKDILSEYRRQLQTHKRDVKNRRYTAMQKLIKQGDYFSELEMMNRAPELYQDLIGQYLSDAEIKQRDSYDVKNTTFSGILMHTMEQQQRDVMLKEADLELEKEQGLNYEIHRNSKEREMEDENDTRMRLSSFVVEEDESEDLCEVVQKYDTTELDEYEVPKACQQQWGNFDNETIACSTSCSRNKSKAISRSSKKSISNAFITAGERDLLRKEFVGIMQERFLAGKDTSFDYSLVDENTQLDDLSQINQDKEDAYFDTSDDDVAEEANILNSKQLSDTESEDELDLYMRHLNQHHSLKN